MGGHDGVFTNMGETTTQSFVLLLYIYIYTLNLNSINVGVGVITL